MKEKINDLISIFNEIENKTELSMSYYTLALYLYARYGEMPEDMTEEKIEELREEIGFVDTIMNEELNEICEGIIEREEYDIYNDLEQVEEKHYIHNFGNVKGKELVIWCWENLQFYNCPDTWEDTIITDILQGCSGSVHTNEGKVIDYSKIRLMFEYEEESEEEE